MHPVKWLKAWKLEFVHINSLLTKDQSAEGEVYIKEIWCHFQSKKNVSVLTETEK